MVAVLATALLAVHGAIHLLGFAKAFGLAELEALALPISKGWGIAWLSCAILLLTAAALRALSVSSWWMLGAAGVIASQVVIIAFWSDARFGTIANGLLLFAIATGFGHWRFERRVADSRQQLRAASSSDVTPAAVDGLPKPVQSWLRASGALAPDHACTGVEVTQTGRMMKAPGEGWMSFSARQWFTISAPGFVWSAQVTMAPGLSLLGQDRYIDGRGAMRIEIAGLYPVVRATGPKIDQGSLVRFLAETMWFPCAARMPYLRWQALDDHSARVEMTYGDVSAQGTFFFDDEHRAQRFEARRYREDELATWIVENAADGHRQLDGVLVPTRSTITWLDEDGQRWTWLELELTSLERRWLQVALAPAPQDQRRSR